MTSPQHFELPLEDLFRRLEMAEIEVDPSRRMRAWRMLNSIESSNIKDLESIKFIFAPLLTRTPTEQEKFYHIFDQFWKESISEWENFSEEYSDHSPTKKFHKIYPGNSQFANYLKFLIGILVLSIISISIYLIKIYFYPEVIRSPYGEFEILSQANNILKRNSKICTGDSISLNNLSKNVDPKCVNWEIRDIASGKILHSDTSFNTTWIAPEAGKKVVMQLKVAAPPSSSLPQDTSRWPDSLFSVFRTERTIQCTNPPVIEDLISPDGPFIAGEAYSFSVKTEKGCLIEWNYWSTSGSDKNENQKTASLNNFSTQFTFPKEDRYTIYVRVYREGQREFCFEESSISINVGENKPYLKLAQLKYDTPREVLQVSWQGWATAFLPLLVLPYLLFRWWKRRKDFQIQSKTLNLKDDLAIKDSEPYFIPYFPQEDKISVPNEFFKIAHLLRRREKSERRELDISLSIDATIKAGGYFTPQELTKTKPSEYLFILEQYNSRDQRFRLFERLTDFMIKRDAPLTVWFHDGRFDHFWQKDQTNVVDFSQLQRQFPQHRLVIIGDGHGLVHPASSSVPRLIAAKIQTILQWPNRLLLTPEAVNGWSYQEELLFKILPLFPADTNGILQGLDNLDRLGDYQLENFEKCRQDLLRTRPEPNMRYQDLKDIDTLRKLLSYDPDLWRWFLALSVCPQPDWALTISVGRAIGVDVTHDRLLALSRIKWLQRNEPEDHLRLGLLAIIDPEDERLARLAVANELELVEEQVKSGFASIEWRTNLAVQHFALDPRDPQHKRAIQLIQRDGLFSDGHLSELEWVVRERADGTGLPPNAKNSLKDWLEVTDPLSWLAMEEIATGIAFSCVSLVFILLGLVYNSEMRNVSSNLAFWEKRAFVGDEALNLNNQAVKLAEKVCSDSFYTSWKSSSKNDNEIYDLWTQAKQSRSIFGIYNLADSNTIVFQYNQSSKGLNFYLDGEVNYRLLDTILNNFKSVAEKTDTVKVLYKTFMFNSNEVSYKKGINSFHLGAQHGIGLCYYYQNKMDSALNAYYAILKLEPAYFDTLSMAVHLGSLLKIKNITSRNELHIVVIDKTTKRVMPNVAIPIKNVSNLKTNQNGQINFSIPSKLISSNIILTSIEKEGYEPWAGRIQVHSDLNFDTILLTPVKKVSTIDNVDTDGDGVLDKDDACPTVKGITQLKGCPRHSSTDADGDGVLDVDDICPYEFGLANLKGCSYIFAGNFSTEVKTENIILQNTKGNYSTLGLQNQGNNGIIFVFFALHDPYCEAYLQRIIDLHKKYASKGFPVVAINPTGNNPIDKQNSYESLKEFVEKKKIPFQFFYDGDKQLTVKAFGVDRTPTVIIVDKHSRVRYFGTIDDNVENPFKVKKRYVEDALEALLRNEDPAPSSTKVVGCKIRSIIVDEIPE